MGCSLESLRFLRMGHIRAGLVDMMVNLLMGVMEQSHSLVGRAGIPIHQRTEVCSLQRNWAGIRRQLGSEYCGGQTLMDCPRCCLEHSRVRTRLGPAYSHRRNRGDCGYLKSLVENRIQVVQADSHQMN